MITPAKPRDTPALLLTLLVTALLFAPISYHAVLRSRDYVTLLEVAYQQLQSGALLDPHFLYGVIVAAIATASGLNPFIVAMVADVVGHMATAWALFALVRSATAHQPAPRRPALRVGGALALQLVWVITIPLTDTLYFGYIGPNPYHSPTQIWLRPMALGLLGYGERVFRDNGALSSQFPWASAALVVVSTLFKPSAIICLLPAMVLWALYRWQKGHALRWRLLWLGFVAPAASVLAWQYGLLQSYRGGIALAPFYVLDLLPPRPWLVRLGLSLLFPMAISVSYGRALRREAGVILAWLMLGFGLGYFYSLAEGHQPYHANFYWSASVASFILFARCYALWASAPDSGGGRWPLMALVWHLLAGVNWWRVHLSAAFPAFW